MSTVRVYLTEDGEWAHASYNNQTAKLRYWSDDREDLTLDLQDEAQNNEFNNITNRAKIFRVNEITVYLTEASFDIDKLVSYKNKSEWLEAIRLLKQMSDDGHEFGEINEGEAPIDRGEITQLIPQTRLRRFYQTLRIFGGIGITTEILNHLNENSRSERISKIIDESVRHFQRYQNIDQPFHGRNINNQTIDQYVDKPNKFAKCMQARMKRAKNNQLVTMSDNTELVFVDYEISPYRTTGNVPMEDNQRGVSGAGGLDLLLVDKNENIPVIGEIKAATDRDLFLALIQALMYAVELSSSNQIERLRNTYNEAFNDLAKNTKVDIYLLFQEEPDKEVKLYDESLALAQQLFANGGKIKSFLRCIKFVHVKLNENIDEGIGMTLTVRDTVHHE